MLLNLEATDIKNQSLNWKSTDLEFRGDFATLNL